jgi:hypothetical protein
MLAHVSKTIVFSRPLSNDPMGMKWRLCTALAMGRRYNGNVPAGFQSAGGYRRDDGPTLGRETVVRT